MKQNPILLIFFFISYSIFAQTITGVVYNNKTNEVLPGASVYLNGTTIGEVSDFNGKFEINATKITNTPLIISYTGFKTISVDPKDFNIKKEFYLEEEPNQLNEIFLGIDVWSREKKLRIFKTQFLGNSEAAHYCSISNTKDIQLVYNSSTQTLIAYANKPITIKNKYLGYSIQYNLTDFEIKYETNLNGLTTIKTVYTEGYSLFRDLKEKVKKRTLVKRERTYRGSIAHFMRSLATKTLSQEKFEIYHNRWPTPPYKFLIVTSENKFKKVEATTNELSILYKKEKQSKITFNLENEKAKFYIDNSGNYFPPKTLVFGGDFGFQRISNLLPLNYIPKTNLEIPETGFNFNEKLNISY